MTVSGDGEFKSSGRYMPKGSKARQKQVRETAEEMAAHDGGEVDDHLAEADRVTRQDLVPYRDDALEEAGFEEKEAYNYRSKTGKLLYQSLRYEHPDVPNVKEFRQRSRPKHQRNGVEWIAGTRLKVPYNWPELVDRADEVVYFTEGEKDADRLMAEGLLATTLAGQKWSLSAVKALAGRDVVILEDNDASGRKHASASAAALHGFAASVKIVQLPGLKRTQDVSDWLDAGHSKDELLRIVEGVHSEGLLGEYFSALDPTIIPKRRWLYKPHYIRQFCSLTISTGGVGKSSLVIAEALAMVTGRSLLTVPPEVQPDQRKLKVWYWNGEDPTDELNRRIAAAIKHFGLSAREVGPQLIVSSGRKFPIVIAEEVKGHNFHVNEPLIQDIIAMIVSQGIDVVIIDPFVTCHRVPENDNAGIERVVKAWAHIAEQTNCAVMLVHHSKKTGGEGATVDDGRGASALLAAARSARSLNTMTKAEAEKAQVSERERGRYFRADIGKTNLTPPAEAADWFKLVTIDLENFEDGDWDTGDHIGVVTAWTYPIVTLAPTTAIDIRRVQDAVRAGGPWRYDQRSEIEPWVGIAVARTLNLDLSNKQIKEKGCEKNRGLDQKRRAAQG